MKRREAIHVLGGLRHQLEARGVVHAALFGSVARDQSDDASDIDIAVSFTKLRKPDLIDLGDVQSLLEEAFRGLRVDVVVEPVRNPLLRDAIERDRANAF